MSWFCKDSLNMATKYFNENAGYNLKKVFFLNQQKYIIGMFKCTYVYILSILCFIK